MHQRFLSHLSSTQEWKASISKSVFIVNFEWHDFPNLFESSMQTSKYSFFEIKNLRNSDLASSVKLSIQTIIHHTVIGDFKMPERVIEKAYSAGCNKKWCEWGMNHRLVICNVCQYAHDTLIAKKQKCEGLIWTIYHCSWIALYPAYMYSSQWKCIVSQLNNI